MWKARQGERLFRSRQPPAPLMGSTPRGGLRAFMSSILWVRLMHRAGVVQAFVCVRCVESVRRVATRRGATRSRGSPHLGSTCLLGVASLYFLSTTSPGAASVLGRVSTLLPYFMSGCGSAPRFCALVAVGFSVRGVRFPFCPYVLPPAHCHFLVYIGQQFQW